MIQEKKKTLYIAIAIVIIGILLYLYMNGRDERSIVGRWYPLDTYENTYDPGTYFEFYDDGTLSVEASNRDNTQYADWQIKNHQLWIRFQEDIGTMSTEIVKMNYSIDSNKYLILWSADEELTDDTEQRKLIRSTEVEEAW